MNHRIISKKGLNIPIAGDAIAKIDGISIDNGLVAVVPIDFYWLTLKPKIKQGEKVKAGDVLLYDKKDERIKVTSPVSGVVESINRGEKRRILSVVVKKENDEYKQFNTINEHASAEQIKEVLLESGLWTGIRQRPFDIIAEPDTMPEAIYVHTSDTSPLAQDYNFTLQNDFEYFVKGVEVLSKLATKTYLTINANRKYDLLDKINIEGVEKVFVKGPHPAGNISTIAQKITPINKDNKIWYVKPWTTVFIGRLALTGRLDMTKIVGLVGPEVKRPMYYRIGAGFMMKDLVKDKINDEYETRIISGSVLTGRNAGIDGFDGIYNDMVSVIKEGKYEEFMGWVMPGLKKYSPSRMFFSWLLHSKKRKYSFDTNFHGEERPFVIPEISEKYVAVDILPSFLLKSIIAEDFNMIEKLGIYEVVPEDFALMEYACVSKINIQEIVTKGIELILKDN